MQFLNYIIIIVFIIRESVKIQTCSAPCEKVITHLT